MKKIIIEKSDTNFPQNFKQLYDYVLRLDRKEKIKKLNYESKL